MINIQTRLVTLAIALAVVVPAAARAQQYGVLLGNADLDGNGTPESVYNNTTPAGSAINVVSGRGVSRYPISNGAWALLYGNFSSVVDLDGQPGAEIPVNIGSTLLIIQHRGGTTSRVQIPSASWAAVPGGITDLDGYAGAEIPIVAPGVLWVYAARTGVLSRYAIPEQYAVLQGGIRDFDGAPGSDIAVATNTGNIVVIRQRSGVAQIIRGAGYFGAQWSVESYGNFDGIAGDEIRVLSSNGRRYQISPAQGTVRAL